MDVVSLRTKLHSLIDTASEDTLLNVLSFLNKENADDNNTGVEYTDEFKAELDAEYEDYQKNPNDVISKEEVDLHVEQLLQKKRQ